MTFTEANTVEMMILNTVAADQRRAVGIEGRTGRREKIRERHEQGFLAAWNF